MLMRGALSSCCCESRLEAAVTRLCKPPEGGTHNPHMSENLISNVLMFSVTTPFSSRLYIFVVNALWLFTVRISATIGIGRRWFNAEWSITWHRARILIIIAGAANARILRTRAFRLRVIGAACLRHTFSAC